MRSFQPQRIDARSRFERIQGLANGLRPVLLGAVDFHWQRL
jgi:hypothetical protein